MRGVAFFLNIEITHACKGLHGKHLFLKNVSDPKNDGWFSVENSLWAAMSRELPAHWIRFLVIEKGVNTYWQPVHLWWSPLYSDFQHIFLWGHTGIKPKACLRKVWVLKMQLSKSYFGSFGKVNGCQLTSVQLQWSTLLFDFCSQTNWTSLITLMSSLAMCIIHALQSIIC